MEQQQQQKYYNLDEKENKMKTLNIRDMIKNLGLEEAICKSFAEVSGKSEEELRLLFDDIVNKEIDSIGRDLARGQMDETKFSRLRGLSLQDFMKDNDKIIKDK